MATVAGDAASTPLIRTPDQRLRVFISSTLAELAPERVAAREAVERLRLTPVMFEIGARPHPAQDLYRAYLDQSHVFVGIYWQQFGWVGPGMTTSGLMDEFELAAELGKPMLLYAKQPAPDLDPRLQAFFDRLTAEGRVTYRRFETLDELRDLVAEDLASVLSERFAGSEPAPATPLEPLDASDDAAAGPASRGNRLPLPPNRFVGRERELAEARAMLIDPSVRILTLCGTGGIGKTRLAVALAEQVRDEYAGGVWFVRLGQLNDAEAVPAAIAAALNLREATAVSPVDAVAMRLGDRRALLILDNFEHVIDAAPVVSQIVERCPAVTVVVTTREVLRISGEHEFPVPPLDLPPTDRIVSSEALLENEAVALFVERATAILPHFELNESNAATVDGIVRRLDGLPLAIELAAARVRALSPEQILSRLDRRLALLTGGPRDLPEHQRAMRNTIGWSYGLLAPSEQRLFQRVSVFSQRWTLAAAEAICDGDADLDVIDGIASLVDKSLVRFVPDDPREPRYTLLESIREFAAEELEARGEAEHYREKHFRHYRDLVLGMMLGLRGPEQDELVQRLEFELDNIRVAERFGLERGYYADLANMEWTLFPFRWIRGHTREGARTCRQVAEHLDALDDRHQCHLLITTGGNEYMNADFDPAFEVLDQGVQLSNRIGYSESEAYGRAARGLIHLLRFDVVAAQDDLQQSIRMAREGGFAWAEALASLALSRMTVALRTDDREDVLQASYAAAVRLGAALPIAASLDCLGWNAVLDSDLDNAPRYLREALTRFWALKQGEGTTRVIEAIGTLAWKRGDPATGVQLFAACRSYRERLGSSMWIADRLQYPEILAGMREALGDEAYEAAWEAGERFTVSGGFETAMAVVRP